MVIHAIWYKFYHYLIHSCVYVYILGVFNYKKPQQKKNNEVFVYFPFL